MIVALWSSVGIVFLLVIAIGVMVYEQEKQIRDLNVAIVNLYNLFLDMEKRLEDQDDE